MSVRQFVRIWSAAQADVLTALLIATVVAVTTFRAGSGILSTIRTAHDVWFGSDTPRVYENMVARDSDHHRTQVHPLFSVTAYGSVYVLRKLVRLDPDRSVMVVVAGWSSMIGVLFFSLLRLIGCLRGAAVLFTTLLAVSSTGMFWLPVPETYALGTISLLAALIVAAAGTHGEVRWPVYLAVSAGTLSFTITNWITGLLVTFLKCPWKRSLWLTATAVMAVIVFCGIQRAVFPTAVVFIAAVPDERRHMYKPDFDRVVEVARAFTFHSVIMPEPKVLGISPSSLPWLHTQRSTLGSGGLPSRLAVLIWAALLAFGVCALVVLRGHAVLRVTLAVALASQFTLHIAYGDETFLYSLHYTPMMIVAVALATLMKTRRVVLALTAVLIVFVYLNNARQFDYALGLLDDPHGRSGAPASMRLVRP